MHTKIYIGICILCFIIGVVLSGIYFSGKSEVGVGTDLYNNALSRIKELEGIKLRLENSVLELTEELTKAGTAITASSDGLGISINISDAITANSSDIEIITRRIGDSTSAIDSASKGLAEIFGVTTEEN